MVENSKEGVTRRTYLKLAGGASAAAGVAGCSDGSDGPDEDSDPTEDGDADGDEGDDGDGDDGTGEAPEEFDVTVTQGSMPSGLDPQDHRETPTDIVVLHAYEGLLARDAEGRIVESLATDYERLEAESTVRFEIREDVSFHNGDSLTLEDVAYSVNRIANDEVDFASPQRDQLAGVTSAEPSDVGEGVEVTSESLNPIVFAEFATYCDVVQQSWIERHEKTYINQNVNGTGPFVLEEYAQDERVVLSRNEDYWREPAHVSQLTFRAAAEESTRVNQLLSEESDLIVNVPPQEVQRINDEEETRIAAAPSTRILYAAMRYDIEPFTSPEFRRALNYAVDLEAIVENVLQGFGDRTGQPTLEGFTGHNPDVSPYPHDPEQAEELIEESGHAGAEIELHTPNGRYLKDFEIAQSVVGYVNDLDNVSASVQQREFGSLVDELLTGEIEDKPHWFLIGWGEATFDGGLVLQALLSTDGVLTTYSDEELDELLDQASSQTNDERESTLQEANRLARDEAPWIFLNRQYSVYGVSERVGWEARRDERIDAYEMRKK